jgi:hypothetical protein
VLSVGLGVRDGGEVVRRQPPERQRLAWRTEELALYFLDLTIYSRHSKFQFASGRYVPRPMFSPFRQKKKGITRRQLIEHTPTLMLATTKDLTDTLIGGIPHELRRGEVQFTLLTCLEFETYLFGIYLRQITGSAASELVIKDTIKELLKSVLRVFQKFERSEGNEKRFDELLPIVEIGIAEYTTRSALAKYPPEDGWFDSATGVLISHLAKNINNPPNEALLHNVAFAVRRHIDAHVQRNLYRDVICLVDWKNV